MWNRFRRDSDLYELDVKEAAAAIKSGPARWDALDEWRAAGGVDGDPYAVCRYAWGPMRARVQLTAAELLAAYLAGDAELTLYRMVLDYGDGPTEFIWPDQPRTCCGYESGCDGTAPPLNVRHWGRPDVYLSERGRYCRVCGAARYFALLTQRRLDSDETAPLGESEPLEALPPATLTAIARDGGRRRCWGSRPLNPTRRAGEAPSPARRSHLPMRPSKVAPGELGLLAGSVRIGTDNRCAAEKCGPRARRSARVSLAQPPSKPRPANRRHTLIANRRRHAAPPPPRASPRTASELRSCVVVPVSGRDWPLVDPGLDLGAAPADGAAAWASEEGSAGGSRRSLCAAKASCGSGPSWRVRQRRGESAVPSLAFGSVAPRGAPWGCQWSLRRC